MISRLCLPVRFSYVYAEMTTPNRSVYRPLAPLHTEDNSQRMSSRAASYFYQD
ncbi:hypothetical protein [Endozoicomonas ascidiicola]|uniref:hypothetical protein n=1 Tax=Endozoicomonas ascidiicola TaxID=1698521 RepID=UPI0012FC696A|nr:hypothetical protein [Endozoicomonas ascidiicola]